jgi:hypothetical protein
MNGPVAVARFEIEGEPDEIGEGRLLRQRQAADVIESLTKALLG